MAAKDRREKICEIIKTKEKVSVTELSELCNVTEETIRKDLTKLEKEGILTRTHGGAVLKQTTEDNNVHFGTRRLNQEKEKKIIGELVRNHLREGATLFADASTTVIEALKMLPDTWDLTVVTNSTAAYAELENSNMNIISTGGKFNKKSLSLQGIVAKECIGKYNVEIALISCKTLDMIRGVQDSNENEADIKRCMIQHAQKVILLVDHTKFNRSSFISLLDIDDVDVIVTDCDPGEEWKEYLEKKGIRLIYR